MRARTSCQPRGVQALSRTSPSPARAVEAGPHQRVVSPRRNSTRCRRASTQSQVLSASEKGNGFDMRRVRKHIDDTRRLQTKALLLHEIGTVASEGIGIAGDVY